MAKKGKHDDIRAICPKCAMEARRVVTIMSERDHGEMAAIFIVARQFVHIAENGARKICREDLPSAWLMTMCGMDEIEDARAKLAAKLSKWNVGTVLTPGRPTVLRAP